MSFPNPFWSQKDTEVEWFVSLELSESQASKTQADKGEAGAEAIGVEPPQRKFQSDRVRQGPTGSDRVRQGPTGSDRVRQGPTGTHAQSATGCTGRKTDKDCRQNEMT